MGPEVRLARRVLLVVAPERFRDEEALVPRHALAAAGHRVTVASTRPGVARGMLGAKLAVDTTVRRVVPLDYHALVVAGGAGAPVHLWDDEFLRGAVRSLHAVGRPAAAICLASAVLARAGVLAGKRATGDPSERAVIELRRGGATYLEEPVVWDGTVVTARGPDAVEAFARALVALLGGGS